MNKTIRILLTATAIFSLCTLALAEDKKTGEMPSMEAMMAEWEKMMAPGAEHEMMAKSVGNWSAVTKMWMDPKAPPLESKGTESCRMIMGGRVCQSDFHGNMMGKSFEGQAMMGYDKTKKKYWMTWVDNMSTTITSAWGTASADGKTITMLGKMDDPMSGKLDKDVRWVFKFVDENTHVMESWDEAGTPNEFKVMEISYTRAK